MTVDFDYIGKPSEGLTRVKIGIHPKYKCGFINSSNEIVIPLIYSNVRNFSEGLAAVRCGNWASDKWGFINKSGTSVIPCIFSKVRNFHNGMTKGIYNGVWYFINRQGERVFCLKKYDGSSKFNNGYAQVWNRNPDDYNDLNITTVDPLGNIIVPKEEIKEEPRNEALVKFFGYLKVKLCD